MKYLRSQKDFKTLEINLLTENLNVSKYNNLFNQIIKDLQVNFYFVATFGTVITAYYPIFDNLVKNSNFDFTISTKDIVLLSICALAILLKENQQTITKMKTIIEEKGYSELLEKFINFITNSNKIFKAIAKNTGKVLVSFVDMFGYTALFVPFLIGTLDLIELYNIGLDTFTPESSTSGILISTSIGILTISIKHYINMLVKKISRLTKKKEIKESLNLDNIISEL